MMRRFYRPIRDRLLVVIVGVSLGLAARWLLGAPEEAWEPRRFTEPLRIDGQQVDPDVLPPFDPFEPFFEPGFRHPGIPAQ